MEEIYMHEKESFVTDEINFAEFFQKYTNELTCFVNFGYKTTCKKSLLKRILDMDEDQYNELAKTCSLGGLKQKISNRELIIPIEGFRSDFHGYKAPFNFTKLHTINALKKRTTKQKVTTSRKLRYLGERDLEEKITREEDDKFKEDMLTCQDYILTVRVYLPAKHRSFTQDAVKYQRPRPLHVSQEFLLPGDATLDALRDRLICQGDFQSVEGDVSSYPWTETMVRNLDVFKSAMFYIGNTFYIDQRHETCKDYASPIIEWGKRRSIQFNKSIKKMEETRLEQLNLRLGYPYVYMHLCNCEHLIVFTDARLLHYRDVHIYSAYPIMKSYANMRGKYCRICRRRLAKFIVTDADRLPCQKMYVCVYCLYLYNYIGYEKHGNFRVYKYVDRVALL